MMRHRLRLLICVIAVSALVPALVSNASAATGGGRGRAPVRRSLPTIGGKPEAGDVLWASAGRWNGARTLSYRWERCNAVAHRCKVIDRPGGRHPYAAQTYKLTASDVGHRIRVVVRATNAWGATSATSRATAVIKEAARNGRPRPGAGQSPTSTPSPTPAPMAGGTTAGYFSTVLSSETGSPPAGIPRSDAACGSEIKPTPENRPQNTTANHSVPSDPLAIAWSPSLN
jgi:hypothetical protein